jgi:hypothetical protein
VTRIDYAKAKARDQRRSAELHLRQRLEREPRELTLARKAFALQLDCFVCGRNDRPFAKVETHWALCQPCAATAPLRLKGRKPVPKRTPSPA